MTNGSVKCWGAGSLGQLGNGSTTSSSVPVDVAWLPFATFIAPGPAAYHSCAQTADNGVYCWGSGYYGQLGNGSTSTIPVRVQGT